jgi:hypothetical protein
MTGFDFAFALFSLVLGLAVAEVLGGFGKVMKLHARARAGLSVDVRVGWLVPLLATLVVLNQLSFWMIAYSVRESLPFSYLTLVGVLVVVGGYYLFSVLVFPDDPADWPDFDSYYDQHNRFILIGMAAINVITGIVNGIWGPRPDPAQAAARAGTLGDVAAIAAFLALILTFALIFVKGRKLNIALLASLIFMDVALAVTVAAAGF